MQSVLQGIIFHLSLDYLGSLPTRTGEGQSYRCKDGVRSDSQRLFTLYSYVCLLLAEVVDLASLSVKV